MRSNSADRRESRDHEVSNRKWIATAESLLEVAMKMALIEETVLAEEPKTVTRETNLRTTKAAGTGQQLPLRSAGFFC